jgi:hypothetical protein
MIYDLILETSFEGAIPRPMGAGAQHLQIPIRQRKAGDMVPD